MDIQKEKDAYLAELLERNAITQNEYNDIIFRPSVNAFDSNYLSARFIDNVNWGWNSWQARAQKVAVAKQSISFSEWISDHKNDYVHFGGYQERAHELAERSWNASIQSAIPKEKILMPKQLSQKDIDFVVESLAISGGVSLISEVYQCLIEAQEQAND